MVAKKAAPKTNTTTTAPSAAVLSVSAFSPPALRQALFASVVLGLDAYRIRLHDVNTGRLRSEVVLDKGVGVNALAWGAAGGAEREKKSAKKKRKRVENGDTNAVEDVVVLAATNRGTVLVLSASEGVVTGVLEGAHVGDVKDVAFDADGKAWSCGVDGKLVCWDVAKKTVISTVALPEKSIQRIADLKDSVLCASSTIYAVAKDAAAASSPATFTANTTLIHSLVSSTDGDRFLSAAESDRFINVFSLNENKQVGALVAESDVHNLSVFKGAQDEVLAAVTAEGVVEVFKTPFQVASVAESPAASRKKKALTRKGDAKIKIVRPGGKQTVSIANVSVHDEELVVAWVEGAVNVEFEKIRWANVEDGSFILNGLVEIARAKTAGLGGVNGATTNGVKDVSKMSVDQSQTVVVGGDDMQDVGMDDADAAAADSSADEADSESDAASDAEPEEPTFADRFSALEVSAKPATSLAVQPTKRIPNTPSAGALTSVLTQALKTNDTALLESCLNSTSPTTIRNTVRKLPSPLAVTLLERLAERLARKPARAGGLGAWVRWTLVAHGGYLVTLPNLMRTLAGLHSTLNTRAAALPRLLALQGRLDMLQAQVELRHELRGARVEGGEEEAGVVYVEGQTREYDSDAESEMEPEEVGMEGMQIEDASYIRSAPGSGSEEEEEESGDERGSSAEEGFLDSENDEEEEEESEDEEEGTGGFLDLEASEASGSEEEEEDEE
ncbi:Dip2/Utp12 family-domain-containing protein [Geopyxis carbonaria]|nr:Dip2/Utp12 family-domain-containing protein [Geopyxis carbonaria]